MSYIEPPENAGLLPKVLAKSFQIVVDAAIAGIPAISGFLKLCPVRSQNILKHIFCGFSMATSRHYGALKKQDLSKPVPQNPAFDILVAGFETKNGARIGILAADKFPKDGDKVQVAFIPADGGKPVVYNARMKGYTGDVTPWSIETLKGSLVASRFGMTLNTPEGSVPYTYYNVRDAFPELGFAKQTSTPVDRNPDYKSFVTGFTAEDGTRYAILSSNNNPKRGEPAQLAILARGESPKFYNAEIAANNSIDYANESIRYGLSAYSGIGRLERTGEGAGHFETKVLERKPLKEAPAGMFPEFASPSPAAPVKPSKPPGHTTAHAHAL